VILKAATARYPRHSYPVGGQAGLLSWLRRHMPDGIFDWVLRRQFRLDG
jgi:hypothetical protein